MLVKSIVLAFGPRRIPQDLAEALKVNTTITKIELNSLHNDDLQAQ